jgi:uncharacterized membrane protein YphA (DoxX/SURF4 family)
MSTTTIRDRLMHVSTLVLRLGAGGVLALDGLHRIGGTVSGEMGQTFGANASGLALNASWSSLAGAGELVVAGLLVLGFLTRIAGLGVLSVLVFSAVPVWNAAGEPAASTVLAPTAGIQYLGAPMLAAVCLSLLVSGSGCVSLDRWVFGRRFRRTEPVVTG